MALVDKYGAFLSAKEGRFRLLVPSENGRRVVKWDLAPVEVDALVFTVKGASISASAIKLASEFGVDLVFLAGLNPYLGFLHKPRAGKMALVFDFMEEFRPA